MRRTCAVVLAMVAAAGCDALLGGELNPAFCRAHPGDPECRRAFPDAAVDASPFCAATSECTAPAVCDVTGSMTCVPCTTAEPAACTGATPVCIGTQCAPCTSHAQCASNACLPDGRCGGPADVAYVAQAPLGSDNTACSFETPCTVIARALATARPFVKLAGSIDEAVSINNQNVSLLAAPGAVLVRTSPGIVVEIRGSSQVAIYDLQITGGTGPSGIGISQPVGATGTVALHRVSVTSNAGGGITAAGARLTIAQSTIRGNVGGGVKVDGPTTIFQITDNFILYNGLALGAAASQHGGALISSNTQGSRFERNTIAFNQSSGLLFRAGLHCAAPSASAAGNLIFHNTEPDGAGGTKTDDTSQRNLSSSCMYGNTLAIATDTANLGFVSPIVAPFDFHLSATTPATVRDAGGACSGVDFDGDPRPIGTACDLGADEFRAIANP